MDTRERELRLEAMRLEAAETLLHEERRFLEAEREGGDAAQRSMRGTLEHERRERTVEFAAICRFFGRSVEELETELRAAWQSKAAMKRRLDGEIATLKRRHDESLREERDGVSRNEREAAKQWAHTRGALESQADATRSCLVAEVRAIEGEKTAVEVVPRLWSSSRALHH